MNVMDYENSKRFRRNKLEEDDNISDNEMENEEWDEGFGAEEFISFDEELQNTMKISYTNVFFKMVRYTKILLPRKNTTTNSITKRR